MWNNPAMNQTTVQRFGRDQFVPEFEKLYLKPSRWDRLSFMAEMEEVSELAGYEKGCSKHLIVFELGNYIPAYLFCK